MNMEVLSVQNQYPAHFALATGMLSEESRAYRLHQSRRIGRVATNEDVMPNLLLSSDPLINRFRLKLQTKKLEYNNDDWKSELTLSTPTNVGSLKSLPSFKFTNTPFKPHHHINHPHHHHHLQRKQQNLKTSNSTSNSSNKLNCDTIKTTTNTKTNISAIKRINAKSLQTQAVQELSLRLLDELRTAKSQHLSCTEVSLPCDLTPRIALEILRLAGEEANGLRDCTIYIEFEDEPNNSRRIATLNLNTQRSSNTGYEIYVTISQDHRGWTALLPQFMKNLSRTITISPEFIITKHRPYSKSLC